MSFHKAMLDLIVLLAYVAFLVYAAARSFTQPRGVFWRSAAGVLAVAVSGAALWALASPSNEAGFGFFAIWCMAVAAALLAALVACAGATARYLHNALKAPAL
jgi:hypothetical protein